MNQKEILELNSKITEMKNLLECFKSRFGQTEERVGEFEYMTMQIINNEKQKKILRKVYRA